MRLKWIHRIQSNLDEIAKLFGKAGGNEYMIEQLKIDIKMIEKRIQKNEDKFWDHTVYCNKDIIKDIKNKL